ncbi:GT2 family glycosyltransferase [Roseibium hamelinense]|uniref:GT2 family glycosyltransferase n=1 Tax=Roseibium hamelinense TaxID=150831 RepID=A0A562T138_9HYPH|nr:glycosyltransferase family 2 protein [Roseibium hamelinense]MTI44705.1 glycosyltransferase family 2 protein [Roseibium hamelinense]TWI87335.1 GT2 family glycosyltransferase [Roseibium hamelinense]
MSIAESNTGRIGVLVCTADRPKMLLRCLKSLAAQEIPESWTLEIVVVENDQEPKSRQAVLEFAASQKVPIHYAQEKTRGIPFARNKSLEQALRQGFDIVALIDDDEKAEDGWLNAHFQTLMKDNISVSYGPVTKTFEVEPPSWFPPEVPSKNTPGMELKRASTNNVAFLSDLINPPHNLRFNPVFLHGYEDLDFFETAHARGFKIVWTPDAVVNEYVPENRLTAARMLGFVRASATAHVQVGILRNGYPKTFVKFGLKGLRRLISSTVLLVILAPLYRGGWQSLEKRYYKNRMRFARAIGNLRGIFLQSASYYDKIDGH